MSEAGTNEHTGTQRGGDWLGATHWSVVLAAGQEGSPQAALAMERLCETYWFPLYAYVRRRGFDVPEAQDLTQGFFAQLLKDKSVSRADPGKGRFRSFLLGALNHYLANEWRRSHAAKRGGTRSILSLDDTAEAQYAQEIASTDTPEKLYERRWALSLFECALRRLHDEYTQAGKERMYEALKDFLSEEPRDGDYRRVGEVLGISPSAVAAAVYRLRQHYRERIREEIAHTVANAEEIEDEMRWLLAAIAE